MQEQILSEMFFPGYMTGYKEDSGKELNGNKGNNAPVKFLRKSSKQRKLCLSRV